jgi:hypothetical protein
MPSPPLLHAIFQAIRRAIAYVASKWIDLYVIAAVAIVHVALLGVSVDEVVRPLMERVGFTTDRGLNEALPDLSIVVDDFKSGRLALPTVPYDDLKDAPNRDFDPLDWDQLRQPLAEAEMSRSV